MPTGGWGDKWEESWWWWWCRESRTQDKRPLADSDEGPPYFYYDYDYDDYCSSESTLWAEAFAVASTEVPACVRI